MRQEEIRTLRFKQKKRHAQQQIGVLRRLIQRDAALKRYARAESEEQQAELDFRKNRVFGCAKQIPYQSVTPISQTQYKCYAFRISCRRERNALT